ncbi:unnamed protein product [Medioppia subpectinata]|uniref:C-type lectin domain-containing protein n=1 Tax=Medioppia subpectinata TaxID=1979941 RepID=A0A7R9Q715_9ACAR|nr:unnamed protein product [Medioppia subpectinata]CAG2115379.1 unnamed protein product [Medioppia subpectinata]
MDKTLAQSECTKLDPKASLMVITSSDEQEFVNKMLTNYSQYTDKVWTGMNNVKTADVYNNWVDGIPYEYTTQITMTRNYNNNYQDTIKMPFCVQMSVNAHFMGKWYSEPCGRRAYAVCQRRQEWTLTILSTALENVTMLVNNQQARINELERNVSQTQLNKAIDKPNDVQNDASYSGNLRSIPIGFVYIQLPNQSEPIHLWPQSKWTDITNEYNDVIKNNKHDKKIIEINKLIEKWADLNENSTTGPDLWKQMDWVELTKDVPTPQTNHTVKQQSIKKGNIIWKRID